MSEYWPREDRIGWVEDAISIIRQYQAYSEEMRKLGRGASPTGSMGHSVEHVISALEQIVQESQTT